MDVVNTPSAQCLPNPYGPGGCVLDYDGDGDLDLVTFAGGGAGATLLRNDGGSFHDVPGAAGLAGTYEGLGCLAFDYDNDKDVDLFFTTNQEQLLFRNDGGTFTDATDESGLRHPMSGSTATAGDIDGDGDLDLFVGQFKDGNHCSLACTIQPVTCVPRADTLWRNEGGTFVDATAGSGISGAQATLTDRFFDIDRDGDLDLYVGSDEGQNGAHFPDHFWQNDGTGHFVDKAKDWGLDVGEAGNSGDTMGVDIVDYNLDGAPDLVSSTSWYGSVLLWECDAGLHCVECGMERGLQVTKDRVLFNWAVIFEDFDRDGWPDLLIANGGFDGDAPQGHSPDQAPLLLWNEQGSLVPHSPPDGDALTALRKHRALIQGDLDGDGLLDVVLTSTGGPVQVLRSRRACGHGLVVRVDEGQAVGARVRVTAGGRTLERQVSVSGSFLSTAGPDLFFGLGTADEADVEVRWLDGTTQHCSGVLADRRLSFTHP